MTMTRDERAQVDLLAHEAAGILHAMAWMCPEKLTANAVQSVVDFDHIFAIAEDRERAKRQEAA